MERPESGFGGCAVTLYMRERNDGYLVARAFG